jgi:hypothetical protein
MTTAATQYIVEGQHGDPGRSRPRADQAHRHLKEMPMDRLAFDCEVKLAGDGDKQGTVEGYASVFNLMDRGGDIVMPGAFKATPGRLAEAQGAAADAVAARSLHADRRLDRAGPRTRRA